MTVCRGCVCVRERRCGWCTVMTFIVTIKDIEIIHLVNRSPLSTRWQPASHLPCPHGPSSASTLPGEEGMRGGEPRPGRLVTGAGRRRCRGLVTHSNLINTHGGCNVPHFLHCTRLSVQEVSYHCW